MLRSFELDRGRREGRLTREHPGAEDPGVARSMLDRSSAILLGWLFVAAACGDDIDTGAGTAAHDGGSGSGSPDDGSSTTAAADDAPGTSTGAPDPTMPADVSGDDDGGGGRIVCDPANAQFTPAEPPAMQLASIQIDPAAMTCAAHGSAGEPPQILLEVRQTGMVDAVTYGIEVSDSTLGVLFEDPSEGDSQVTQLPPDLPITITGTLVDGGTPISIDFEIFSTGPTVVDVAIELG